MTWKQIGISIRISVATLPRWKATIPALRVGKVLGPLRGAHDVNRRKLFPIGSSATSRRRPHHPLRVNALAACRGAECLDSCVPWRPYSARPFIGAAYRLHEGQLTQSQFSALSSFRRLAFA